MHEELVVRRRWIGENRFLHALSFCTLLPGPEAQQLAIYSGWLLHGTRGGLAAGTLFVLPAAVLMLALSWLYAVHGRMDWVSGVFDGLAAGVVGIVAAAGLTLAKRALPTTPAIVVAVTVLLAIFLVGVPFPMVVLGAGSVGMLLEGLRPGLLVRSEEDEAAEPIPGEPERDRPSAARASRVLVIGLAIWWIPLVLAASALGLDSVYATEARFFSQMAVVSFGGAYAVLAYLAQEVTSLFGLSAADVVAGLGLAETTPGPLILVVQFIGFQAAYQNPGELSPLLAGLVGSLIFLWATFVPSFLWIFLGAPYVEAARERPLLRAGLAAITAAVVGVLASLALLFATHVLFGDVELVSHFWAEVPIPVWGTLDVFALLVAATAFVGMWRFRWNVVWVVVGSAAVGLVWALVR
jgi:chromate transporter